uniref:Uncharacterized protein n=1 Tax=Ananas comosus var. bracteatus TaxID=296719 RepID=A0A6V7Q2X9_ANACO|nr:unnamed protein product [Ananas comosus var. bracteatus]
MLYLDWAVRAGGDRSLLQGPVPEGRPSAARAAARDASGLSLGDRSLGDRSLRQGPVPESWFLRTQPIFRLSHFIRVRGPVSPTRDRSPRAENLQNADFTILALENLP